MNIFWLKKTGKQILGQYNKTNLNKPTIFIRIEPIYRDISDQSLFSFDALVVWIQTAKGRILMRFKVKKFCSSLHGFQMDYVAVGLSPNRAEEGRNNVTVSV